MMLLLAALLAVQDPAYDTLMLEAGPRADQIEARDLNGDGKPDLIIQNGRDLQIFLQKKDRSFEPKPSVVLRLQPTAFLWTFGHIDGENYPSVFTAGARGIQTYAFDGTAFGPPVDRV